MMKNIIVTLLTTVLCCAASGSNAATEQFSATLYDVVTKLGEKETLQNGTVIVVGEQDHASIVNDKTGEQTSQWCNYDYWPDPKGMPTHSVGHCTVFYDNGDLAFIATTGTTNDQPVTWTVLGGTGKYAGATGGGTSKMTSMRSDGYAATFKASGTITTK
jgi:hypothetical protein